MNWKSYIAHNLTVETTVKDFPWSQAASCAEEMVYRKRSKIFTTNN